MVVFFAVLGAVATLLLGLAITFANMMSDAPTVQMSYWPLLWPLVPTLALVGYRILG